MGHGVVPTVPVGAEVTGSLESPKSPHRMPRPSQSRQRPLCEGSGGGRPQDHSRPEGPGARGLALLPHWVTVDNPLPLLHPGALPWAAATAAWGSLKETVQAAWDQADASSPPCAPRGGKGHMATDGWPQTEGPHMRAAVWPARLPSHRGETEAQRLSSLPKAAWSGCKAQAPDHSMK